MVVRDVGVQVDDTYTHYATATGLVDWVESRTTTSPVGTGAPKSRITRGYDDLGRQISYTDGAGNTAATRYDQLDRPTQVSDSAPSTTTYSYGTSTTGDPRGLLASLTDSAAGTFTAGYDADGGIVSLGYPGGVAMTQASDPAGTLTGRTWTKAGLADPLLDETVGESVHSQWLSHQGNSAQTYAYDRAGRLTGVLDTVADPDGNRTCTARAYAFDSNSNRTGLATTVGVGDGSCPALPVPGTTGSYDSADRLQTAGYAYDTFGRTTAMPSGTVIGYYKNDLVQHVSGSHPDPGNPGATQDQTWTLDPAGRFSAYTVVTSPALASDGTSTNHYGGDGDSPDWINEKDPAGAPVITRNVTGPAGDLAAVSRGGAVVLQLAGLHGDIAATLDLTTAAAVLQDTDEYGNPRDNTAPGPRYGWLGADQRSAQTPTGLVLMGVRLYNPASGRFLSTDPVRGGALNAYDYATQDPVNKSDLDGRCLLWCDIFDFPSMHDGNGGWHKVKRSNYEIGLEAELRAFHTLVRIYGRSRVFWHKRIHGEWGLRIADVAVYMGTNSRGHEIFQLYEVKANSGRRTKQQRDADDAIALAFGWHTVVWHYKVDQYKWVCRYNCRGTPYA